MKLPSEQIVSRPVLHTSLQSQRRGVFQQWTEFFAR